MKTQNFKDTSKFFAIPLLKNLFKIIMLRLTEKPKMSKNTHGIHKYCIYINELR